MNDKDNYKTQIVTYLVDYLGINIKKNFNCLNPDHQDQNPSMSYHSKRDKVHCFSCGADYDLFDLIGIFEHLDTFDAQLKKARELFSGNQPLPDTIKKAKKEEQKERLSDEKIAEHIELGMQYVHETDYFLKRGLSQETITRYKLGYDPWTKKALIPVGPLYYILREINDNLKPKYLNLENNPVPIFNADYIANSGSEKIFITESAIDAMSIEEAGHKAIGLNSAQNDNKLIDLLKKHRPKNTFILALDNDEAGRSSQLKISTSMSELNIAFKTFNMPSLYKDPNEALIADREAFTGLIRDVIEEIQREEEKQMQDERDEYQRNSAAHYLNEFKNGITSSIDTPSIPTGFSALDAMLDGGLYEGLYIIGAISSLGKTTFILQVADQMAQQEQDVLIFSLEMSRSELIAKSISRLTFLKAKNKHDAKTVRGILTGKRYLKYSQIERDLITDSTNDYGNYAQQIYISEGTGDIGASQIRTVTEKHIRMTGKKPVIIIDYLQILAPYDLRSTDKQNTDKAVLELKRISRDYKTPVIAISSFNRQNYNQPVTMEAFKESGAIEYSSDILLGLQAKGAGSKTFDINEAKRKDPREIELVILKNRNGKTGEKISYEFYPMFNYFKEEWGEIDWNGKD